MKNLFLILIATLFSFSALSGNVGGNAAMKTETNIKSDIDVYSFGQEGNVGGN